MTVIAILPVSVFAEGEAELLDRNRNQGIGDKSYAEIISEATADISFEEQEKTVKDIEICSEEYELVYEYYFNDLYSFKEKEYSEIVANSAKKGIYVPVTGEVDGDRKLVGQICIYCQDGEVIEVIPEFAQIFNDGRVVPFHGNFLEQRVLINELVAACWEKGATRVTDAFYIYAYERRTAIKAMLIETDIGTLVYEFGYNDYSDGFYLYTVEEFIEFCNKIAEGPQFTFWQAMKWAGYLPLVISAVMLLLLAAIVITGTLIIKKCRKRVTTTPTEAEEQT